MLTIKQAVRKALSQTRGNWAFDVGHIMDLIDNMDDRPQYSRDSVSRAIRNAKGVEVVAVGSYKMGGRRIR